MEVDLTRMSGEITRIVAITVVVAVLVISVAEGSHLVNPLMPLPNAVNAVPNPDNPNSMIVIAVADSIAIAVTAIYGLFTGSGPPILSSVETALSNGAGTEGRKARVRKIRNDLEPKYRRFHPLSKISFR